MANSVIRGDPECVPSRYGIGLNKGGEEDGGLPQGAALSTRNHSVPCRLNGGHCVFSFEGSH